VYQRKLQRWLKHGPNHNVAAESSFSQASLQESQLEISHTQSENVFGNEVDDEQTVPAVGHGTDITGRGKPRSEHRDKLPQVSQGL
jgi:hypothetical protein